VKSAVKSAVEKFGGIDIVINNASAISLTPTHLTEMKRYDLMHQVNTRGTFLVSKECLPYLQKSNHAHILNISPPLSMKPHWFSNHVAYTMAKYGMSMCVLGMAEEFKSQNIAVNALWPQTGIYTAALEMLSGDDSFAYSRKPEIMSDAAYAILIKEPRTCTGNFLIDEKVLKEAGITDLVQYACMPENADKLMADFFLDDFPPETALTPGSYSSGSKGEGEEGAIAMLFSKIEKHMSPEIIEKTGAIYQFEVLGDEAGTWHLDLKNLPGKAGRGPSETTPDATLTMDSKDFFNMLSGQLKPANAFLSGKLKINGDMRKAMKMEKLMSALKNKAKL
jgi:NAD(P)-dependent dehydrogenase (short-subunit alcohol dehydrogenase family)/putative sterol carrier protein